MPTTAPSHCIDLSGKWNLHSADGTFSVPAFVPGDTHSALLAAKRIPDPYFARNELDLLPLGRQSWVYEREVEVSAAFLGEESICLELEGVDTVARVLINGREVGNTRNAFVRYRFEAKAFLRPGRNTVRIEIASPEVAAEAEAKKLAYPIPHNIFPVQSRHRNLLRKVQHHAGWDWAPCVMVSGIERARLIAATTARIETVRVAQRHAAKAGGSVTLTVTCEVHSPTGGSVPFAVELEGKVHASTARLQPGLNVLTKKVSVAKPRLWWPNGHGAQPLYPLVVRAGGSVERRRIGLRTVEVVNKPDKDGVSMTFVVNGKPLFAKGANWVPADALPQRQTREALEGLFSSIVAAHMNMLRVWGGGRYESDAFYDLCDEKGILVWQDFMFSCSLYPSTPDFLDNVREEARWQIKRLNDRACLALWCGNNENLGALGWYEEPKKKRELYFADYDRLNEGVLGAAVRELAPERLFWPTSPCGGPDDYSDCWKVDNMGDMHYWDVWHERTPLAAYETLKPRFLSEFGFESLPSLSMVRSFAPASQWNLYSPVMEHRQRYPASFGRNGNERIADYLSVYFRAPESFESLLYLSQVLQGIAIRTAAEHCRRIRPRCMGVLYWQLNDVWPSISCSSLEYGGKWKVLHHMARRFFAPFLVSATRAQDGSVEIWADHDAVSGKAVPVTVRVRAVDFGGKTLKVLRFASRLGTTASQKLRTFRPEALGLSDPEKGFLVVEMRAGGKIVRNELFLAAYKRCELETPRIALSVRADARGAFAVTLRTDRPAFFVTLDPGSLGLEGTFDDNAVTLLPGEPRVLRFTPKAGAKIGAAALRKALSLHHLRSTYR